MKLSTTLSFVHVFPFQKCRKKHGETLSLQDFLLTPIQKICRYQMQLAELLKNTSEDHEDFRKLKFATEEMRRAAFEINERRRRFEMSRECAGDSSDTLPAEKGNDPVCDSDIRTCSHQFLLFQNVSATSHAKNLKIF